MRSGEAWQLEWTDINFEHRTVSVTPEKGSNPRALPISTELIAMLKGLSKEIKQSLSRNRYKLPEELQ